MLKFFYIFFLNSISFKVAGLSNNRYHVTLSITKVSNNNSHNVIIIIIIIIVIIIIIIIIIIMHLRQVERNSSNVTTPSPSRSNR